MKKIFNRYFLLVLLVSFFFSKSSKAQCDNPSLQQEGVFIGPLPGQFDVNRCPKKLPITGGGYAYIGIDGKEVCLVTDIVTKPNGGNLIYWPKNKPMNWAVQAYLSFGYDVCSADNYFVIGNAGPDVYSNHSYVSTFNASEVGFYKIGAHVVLKEGGWEQPYKIVWGHKVPWGLPYLKHCPEYPPRIYNGDIFIHVCVVDCGGGGSITMQTCGDNVLHRPENTADYEYFWQGMQCGTDMSNGDPTYPFTASGTYYLRGRNKATGVWGDCISIKADYNNGPSLSTPPVPTVNGNTCGNVTLTMPPAPTGVTYYWQDEGCKDPRSTLKAASNPYPVDKAGTYYVSAFNGSCWSSCSAVTPVINAISLPTVTNAYACLCDNVNPSTGKPDVTVHATPSAYANTCKWYTKTSVDPDPPVYSSIGTGLTKTFSTNSDETYYVSSYNSTTLCESAKVPVYIKFKSCTKCIESFTPIPGKKYVISAWVKEQNSFDATTYNNGYLRVLFNGATAADKIFKASGEIIDGWQKIEESFTIDNNVDGIRIEMSNGGATGDVFFDDVRLFPFDGNMVSYVYDPITLKLVAELDANNYATYYIYDDEGQLTKVKKETTGGIKTIKEGRANTVIQ
jgi:hypothetical protein